MSAQQRSAMDEAARFLLLELNDALFPIGAYAHSFGLETYVQEGILRDGETAGQWLEAYFAGPFLYGELLAARLAYEVMEQERGPECLAELEEEARASRGARESREALQKLGRRLAANARKIGLPYGESFASYLEKIRGECSYPVCYGALTASLHLPEREALLHYLYAQISSMTNTCVKLIPLSQTEGARLVYSFASRQGEIMERVMQAGREDLFRSFPGLDIRAMQHEDLYSRLYMS